MPASKDCTTANRTVEKQYNSYQVCDGPSHTFKRYYLVLNIEKEWISKEAQKTFRNNMKVPSFKEEIEKVRFGIINKWQWEDESEAKVKVISETLAFQSYQKSSDNCSLLNSAASIHVFHSKERFSNFKRPARRQELLYGKKIVQIEG